jgi:hypothetical protein
MPSALSGCSDPTMGEMLARYLEDELSAGEIESFEAHAAICEKCLEGLQIDEALGKALGQMASSATPVAEVSHGEARRVRTPRLLLAGRQLWISAAVGCGMLLVLALTWYFRLPSTPKSFEVKMGGEMRGIADEPVAPRGRPLILSIGAPISHLDTVSYNVVVTETFTGAEILTRTGVRPAGESEIRLDIPEGLPRAGRYDVRVMEITGTGIKPLEETFHFSIAESP